MEKSLVLLKIKQIEKSMLLLKNRRIVGWQTGTTTLSRSQLYPPSQGLYEFGYWRVDKKDSRKVGGGGGGALATAVG
jgi:hypothetical protein